MATNEEILAFLGIVIKRLRGLRSKFNSFEISVVEGSISWRFAGSEWKPVISIDALRGRDGRDGVDGKDGQPGRNGIDGRPGRDGSDGKDGKDGVDGKPGERGQTGQRGERGPVGKDGKNGKDGRDGKDGAPGRNGKNGANGDIGPMPKHRWIGTRLQFQKPDGKWGESVDLAGVSLGGGMPRDEVVKLIEGIDTGAPMSRVVHVTGIDYVITDAVDTVACTAPVTITIPATSAKRFTIKNYGTDDVTIVTPGAQLVERNADLTLNIDLFAVDLEQLPNGDWMVV